MSQEPKISDFLSGKPTIEPIQQSSLLSRLRTFLPQMEEANRNMPEGNSADAFQIENVQSKEDSSDDSDESSDESDVEKVVEQEQEQDKLQKPSSGRIEIDLDVFRETNSKVDGRDVSVQHVEQLPAAFQHNSEEAPKKVMIEELS